MNEPLKFSLIQLQRFLVLAEELHFTRAAERLGISQPLLSEQIKSLEAGLGASLLQRSSRKVQLTPAGSLLSDRVQLLLNGLRDSVASARELASGQKAPLRIGYTDEFSRSVLPGLVRHLKEHEASADIRLTTGMAQELPARVSDGLIDLALLCPMPEEQPHPAWHVQLLPPAELVVGLRHEHPLALGAAVSLAQIADEPFVASAIPGAGTEILVERLLAQEGLRRKVVQTVDDPHLLNSLVASGVGILVATAEDFAPYATLRAVPLSPRVTITRGAISRSFNQSELLQRARTYIASEAFRSDDALF